MNLKFLIHLASLVVIFAVLVSCSNSSGKNHTEGDFADKGETAGGSSSVDNESDGDISDTDGSDKTDIPKTDGENDVPETDGDVADLPNVDDNPTSPDDSEKSETDESGTPSETVPTVGTKIGDLAPTLDLERLGGGTVNTEEFRGKIVVINVWGTWCPPCRNELPDFNRVANEYADEVVILAVHSSGNREAMPGYVNTNFRGSKIVFAYDTSADAYHSLIGGTVYYPRTVILDKNGVITYADDGAVSYDFLVSEIENAKAK